MTIRLLLLFFLLPVFILTCDGNDNTDAKDENKNGKEEEVDPNDNLPALSSVKIMTYNIHTCNPPSKPGEADVEAIAIVIKAANPDIVFLQEVDKNTGRNGNNDDQANELAKKTGMNAQFFSALSYGRGFYGVAILTKYKIEEAKAYLLPKYPNLEQRVLGTVAIKLTAKERIMAAVTHLQHNSQENRMEQIAEVVRVLKNEKLPVILGGDFNEKTTATDFFEIFDNTFTRTCVGYDCPYTFPATTPSSMIDYLAFKPETAFVVNSHNIINETYASDHLPVVSILAFER
jgi:endonuclease/exonuclease/phosphatase family metal-dependent hydrolase